MFHSCFKKSMKFKIQVSLGSIICNNNTSLSKRSKLGFQQCSNFVGNDAHINEELKTKKGGFAKAYEKFSIQEITPEENEPSFLSLMKNSKFVDLGDPEGKIVTGTIIHVVDDDLYVDFGWKFHSVVSRPAKYGHEYVRGARVRLSLKDLELSTRFLGSEKDLTLLEADAILIGLVSSPARPELTSIS